jgi:hypothetical protein
MNHNETTCNNTSSSLTAHVDEPDWTAREKRRSRAHTHLHPGALLAQLGALVRRRVQGQVPAVHRGVGAVGALGPEDPRRGGERELEVGHPLERALRAAPRHDDVPAPERGGALVRGHGHVPHPVALPGAAPAAERAEQHLAAHLGAGRGVDVPRGRVPPRVRHVHAPEQVGTAVPAHPGVRGPALADECLVRGHDHLAVGDEAAPEADVQRLQQALPVPDAVQLPPPPGHVAGGHCHCSVAVDLNSERCGPLPPFGQPVWHCRG